MHDVLAMKPQETKLYLQAMERIRARERLVLMDALQYPIMQKPSDKRKKHKEVYKAAYPENFENRTVKTTDLELI